MYKRQSQGRVIGLDGNATGKTKQRTGVPRVLCSDDPRGDCRLTVGYASVVQRKAVRREDGEPLLFKRGGNAVKEQAVHEDAAGKRNGAHTGGV